MRSVRSPVLGVAVQRTVTHYSLLRKQCARAAALDPLGLRPATQCYQEGRWFGRGAARCRHVGRLATDGRSASKARCSHGDGIAPQAGGWGQSPSVFNFVEGGQGEARYSGLGAAIAPVTVVHTESRQAYPEGGDCGQRCPETFPERTKTRIKRRFSLSC